MKKVNSIISLLAGISLILCLVSANVFFGFNVENYVQWIFISLLFIFSLVMFLNTKASLVRGNLKFFTFLLLIPLSLALFFYFFLESCFNFNAILIRMSGTATTPATFEDYFYYFSFLAATLLVFANLVIEIVNYRLFRNKKSDQQMKVAD